MIKIETEPGEEIRVTKSVIDPGTYVAEMKWRNGVRRYIATPTA